jgi:hypothetical protein
MGSSIVHCTTRQRQQRLCQPVSQHNVRTAIALRMEDFPQPDGPTISNASPACTIPLSLWQSAPTPALRSDAALGRLPGAQRLSERSSSGGTAPSAPPPPVGTTSLRLMKPPPPPPFSCTSSPSSSSSSLLPSPPPPPIIDDRRVVACAAARTYAAAAWPSLESCSSKAAMRAVSATRPPSVSKRCTRKDSALETYGLQSKSSVSVSLSVLASVLSVLACSVCYIEICTVRTLEWSGRPWSPVR